MKLLCNQTAFLMGGGVHIQAFTGLIKAVMKSRKLKCEASIKKKKKTRQHVLLNIELFLTGERETLRWTCQKVFRKDNSTFVFG